MPMLAVDPKLYTSSLNWSAHDDFVTLLHAKEGCFKVAIGERRKQYGESHRGGALEEHCYATGRWKMIENPVYKVKSQHMKYIEAIGDAAEIDCPGR